MQGPGTFIWLSFFFRLFGTTFETARAVLTITGIALVLLTFWLSRRLGAKGLAAALFVLVTSIPAFPAINPHYDSSLLVLLALVIFLPAWDRLTTNEGTSNWRLICSGALCGLATWTLQQKGLYFALGLLVSLVWTLRKQSTRPALVLSTAYGIVALLPLAFFAILRALPDILYANFIWPLSTYSQTNSVGYGFPIWQNLRQTIAAQAANPIAWTEDIAFYMPFLIAAFLPWLLPAVARLSGKHWFAKTLSPYWLAAYALWFSELHRMDIGHLRNGVLLMAMLFFSICEAGRNVWIRRAGLVLGLCVALSGASHFLIDLDGRTYQTRRGTVRLANTADNGESLLNFLSTHTNPNEEVLIYPYQPIYYFAAQLRNPSRFSNLMYGTNTSAQFAETVDRLEQKRVHLVILDTVFSGQALSNVFPAYHQPPDSQLVLEPYLQSHYRPIKDLGRFRILERIP